jgi:hypothetical protein
MKHRAELCELCVVKRAGCSAAKIRGHLEARSIYSVIRSKITVLSDDRMRIRANHSATDG